MKRSNVVVSGIGMITPLGATADVTARAWIHGEYCSKEPIKELCGTEYEGREAAVLPEFNIRDRLGGQRMTKYMSESALLGCIAASEAMQDADVKKRFRPEKIGLYSGTGLVPTRIDEAFKMIENSIDENGSLSYRLMGERGLSELNPLAAFKTLANMPPCIISIIEEIRGPSLIFAPWAGQTAAALQEAWYAVSEGHVDCALAGAADCPNNAASLIFFDRAGLLSNGKLPAPGAGYLVLERRETAEKNSGKIYGGILNIQVTNSGKAFSDPLGERMGHTFAASPVIMTGISLLTGQNEIRCCGFDGQEVHIELEIEE